MNEKIEDKVNDKKIEIELEEKILNDLHSKMISLEEKYLENKIEFEVYNRWHLDLKNQIQEIKPRVEEVDNFRKSILLKIERDKPSIGELKTIYSAMPTRHKQNFLSTLFNHSLYYKDGVFKSKYILPVFEEVADLLEKKKLLVIEKEDDVLV